MLLPILSHDKHMIDYKITEKIGKGKLQTLHTVIKGWPATIFCTTSRKYIEDLATRCFTTSPRSTHMKFKEANMVTGLKNAYPWEYEEDRESLRNIRWFVQTFKACMKEYAGVVIPYAEHISNIYCHSMGRDMRDLKNFFECLKVLTALHWLQRSEIQIEGKKYIVSRLQDFAVAQKIFFEIFETTRTSLPEHVLSFFHEVLSNQEQWEVTEAVNAYNERFNPPRTSRTIRRYFEMLTEVGYVDEKPHPENKRKNMYVVQKVEKPANMVFFREDLLSSPEWRNTVETWLKKCGHKIEKYICKYKDDVQQWHERELDPRDSSSMPLSNEELKIKTENTAFVHIFSLNKVKNIEYNRTKYLGTCHNCGNKTIIVATVELFSGEKHFVCEDCRRTIQEALKERDQT